MHTSTLLFALAATASARVVPLSFLAGTGASTSFSCSASAGVQSTSNILTCIPVFSNIVSLNQLSTEIAASLGARTGGLPINVNGQVAAGAGVKLGANGLPIAGVCPTGFTAMCCSENTNVNAATSANTGLASALASLGVNNLNLGCIGAAAQ